MASTSASSVQRSFKYDVFLSFRGEDVRKTFVDHLYHALVNKGIMTYKDDEKIQKGKTISDQLIRSIQDSRFHIIVFSKNYASSSWCLSELVEIMKCQKMTEYTPYPIFFDVEPTEVRHQSGSVGKAFAKHEKEDDVGRWRNALKEAAGLAGMELKNTFNGHEAKFIQQIAEEVSLMLHRFNSSIDENLVGMETRVKDVVSSLEIDSNDVRMIGIKGIGGGGKTTLARAVFDTISIRFEGKSFVENVREVSCGSLFGLKDLQQLVLRNALNDQSINVPSVSDGKNMMKKIMASRKILLVLDDVDKIDQLEALAGEPTWYKPGSRIIITTRDEQVLKAYQVNFIHDVSLLLHEEAICLFNRYAFRREIPNQGYQKLSRKIVHYAAGLPLTIKVLGSFLYGRIEDEWEDTIKRLKTIPLKETLEKLELSYNGLENDQKEIFLDIVCLLKGETKKEAIKILESCGFRAQIGLRVLEQKSLISISKGDNDDGRLLLHDHIEEMGRNIVRRLHPHEPKRHSRLWIKEEIEDILANESVLNSLKFLDLILCELRTFDLTVTPHLEELNLNGCGDLVELQFPNECPNLKFLDLSYSKVSNLNLGMTPHLEKLNLEYCEDFVELQLPVECPNLKHLYITSSKVRNLNLGLTPNLENLCLRQCRWLQKIHAPTGCLKKLVYLFLFHCSSFERFEFKKQHESDDLKITAYYVDTCPLHGENNIPSFGFECIYDEPGSSWSGNLEKLISSGSGLCACKNLEYLLATICGLQHLRKLTLQGSIPRDQWQFKHLKSLTIFDCEGTEQLQENISRLECLEELRLEDCISLRGISNGPMKCLKRLHISSCDQIEKLAEQVGCLEELYIFNCLSLREITDIAKMKCLKRLCLFNCLQFERLPEELGHLECLEKLEIWDCILLRDIPNSICKMKCLITLNLCLCKQLEKLPEEVGRLECLKELHIYGTGISCLPKSINQLKGLRIIGSREQLQSCGFTSVTETNPGSIYWNCYVGL